MVSYARHDNFAIYPFLHLNEVMPKVDRTIAIHKSFANVITNYVYYKLIDRYTWMVEEITRSSRLREFQSFIQMTCNIPVFFSKLRHSFGGSSWVDYF